MAPRKKDGRWYGDSIDDLGAEMTRYSERNGHPATHFWKPVCPCRTTERGGAPEPGLFALEYDDDEGAAWVVCEHCDARHAIADSAEHSAKSNAGCYCPEDEELGEVLVGASLFPDSDDLRWLYVGWRAPSCGLVGVFVDWKYDGSMTWAQVRDAWTA